MFHAVNMGGNGKGELRGVGGRVHVGGWEKQEREQGGVSTYTAYYLCSIQSVKQATQLVTIII